MTLRKTLPAAAAAIALPVTVSAHLRDGRPTDRDAISIRATGGA